MVSGVARSNLGTPNVVAATPNPAAPVTFKNVLRSMPFAFLLFLSILGPPFIQFKKLNNCDA
jgi:hypothetical protein